MKLLGGLFKKKKEQGTKKESQSLLEEKPVDVSTFAKHLKLFNTAIALLETLKKPLDSTYYDANNYFEIIMQLSLIEFEAAKAKIDPALLKAMGDFYQAITNLKLVHTYLNSDSDTDFRFEFFKEKNKVEVEKLVLAYKDLEEFLKNMREAFAPKLVPEVHYLPPSYRPLGLGR